MYDKNQVINNMQQVLETSCLSDSLVTSQYDMSRLSSDYMQILLCAHTKQHDEDDRLIYFILVLEDILKSEKELTFEDLDDLYYDTYDLFKELLQ